MEPKENHFKQVTDARQIFFRIPTETDEDLQVVSVGCDRCLPEFLVDRKTFPQNANKPKTWTSRPLSSFWKGKKVQLGDELQEVKSGSIFTYSRGVPHRIENSKKNPMLKYFLVCTHNSAKQPFKAVHSGKAGFFQITSIGEVMELFELILSNGTRLRKCVIHLQFSCKSSGLKLCEKANHFSNGGSLAWNTYNRALQFMRRNYFHSSPSKNWPTK